MPKSSRHLLRVGINRTGPHSKAYEKARGRIPSARTVDIALKAAVLAAYQDCGSVRRAACAAGVGANEPFVWMKKDKAFKEAMDGSRLQLTDEVKGELFRRGVHGTPRQRFHEGREIMVPQRDKRGAVVKDEKGKPIMVPYYEYEYSDRCLELLAKSLAPGEFRERVEHQVEGEIIHKVIERQAKP